MFVRVTRVTACVPCVPCVSRLPPVSFYRYRYCSVPVVSRLPPVSFVTGTGTVLYRDFYRCVPAPPGVFEPGPPVSFYRYRCPVRG